MCKTIRSYILQRISNVNLTTKISIPPKPLYTNMGQKCLALIAQIDAWIRSLGVRVPLMSRHYLSQKLILSQRHPFLSLNECYCQRTVNIPNVNFITKIYIFETYHLVHRFFCLQKALYVTFAKVGHFGCGELLSDICSAIYVAGIYLTLHEQCFGDLLLITMTDYIPAAKEGPLSWVANKSYRKCQDYVYIKWGYWSRK